MLGPGDAQDALSPSSSSLEILLSSTSAEQGLLQPQISFSIEQPSGSLVFTLVLRAEGEQAARSCATRAWGLQRGVGRVVASRKIWDVLGEPERPQGAGEKLSKP